jgi:hypothetical protein
MVAHDLKNPLTAIQIQAVQLPKLRPPLSVERVRDGLTRILDQLFDHYPYLVPEKDIFQAHLGPRLKILSRRGGIPLPRPELAQALWWPQEVRDYLASAALATQFPGPACAELRQAGLDLLLALLGPNLEYDREASAAESSTATISCAWARRRSRRASLAPPASPSSRSCRSGRLARVLQLSIPARRCRAASRAKWGG